MWQMAARGTEDAAAPLLDEVIADEKLRKQVGIWAGERMREVSSEH